MTNIARAPDGCNRLADGKLTQRASEQFGFGRVGCAYRGSLLCNTCQWAQSVPVECGWNCERCNYRRCCKCGHDGRTLLVEMVFGLLPEGERTT